MESSMNRQKFVDLAQKRVTKALHSIRLIGNLSNRTNYKYDDGDVKKIIGALKKEVNGVQERFSAGATDSEPGFKL